MMMLGLLIFVSNAQLGGGCARLRSVLAAPGEEAGLQWGELQALLQPMCKVLKLGPCSRPLLAGCVNF
jgi:hypothetical protein